MPVFSYGCAVFLQSDIVNFLRQGWRREEILAGLAAVLPKNIWLYVAKIPHLPKLGRRFILQGGTQNNLAAVKAQADYIRSRFDDLVRRGEAVTDRWIQRGQIEESHSRRLVLTATQDTFDASMEQLGQAPELQNLVKAQSAGLSREMLDEVRARTVSGDLVAEGFVRRVLGRAPRSELPGPAETTNASGEESQEQ